MPRQFLAKAAIAALMGLSGCGTAYPGSPQACAGINDVNVTYDAKTGSIKAALCGGKEYDAVKLSGKTPNGLEFLFDAEGAKAFNGQMTQAGVNKELHLQTQAFIRELIGALNPSAPFAPPLVP